ncbi:MAG: DUF4349 domain-containing protein [Treponema sp.]|nr:DUF4349 domain-containing protein [Treponema sp.]
MKDKKIVVFVFLTCVACLLYSCGGADMRASKAAYEPQYAADYSRGDGLTSAPAAGTAESALQAERAVEGPEPADVQTRKLVRRAELLIRVEDPGAVEKPLGGLMQKYGAWASSTTIQDNSRDYTLRVPHDSYDAMVEDLIGLGKLLRRSESAEDVTLNYYDLESRLAVKQELLKTYQGYLGKAKTIEEIMTVEQKIAELQQDIDWTGTRFRNLSHLVDYATIEFEVSGPAASYAAPTMGERFGGLFGSFGGIASSALVVLVGIVIYGVPALLILIVLFWLLFGRIGFVRRLMSLASGKGKAKN